MPSENIDPPTPTRIGKAERMEWLINALNAAQPVSTVEEAWRMAYSTLRKVEERAGLNALGGEMKVPRLDLFSFGNYNSVKIRYYDFNKHVLLLGENGAVSIFDKEDKVPLRRGVDISLIKQYLKCVLSKPGANNKDVWGETKIQE